MDETSPAQMLAFPSRPEDRLRRALRKLEDALAEQGVAVAGFRANLAELSTAVGGLGGSLQEYRQRLAGAASSAQAARDQARQVEARADVLLNRAK